MEKKVIRILGLLVIAAMSLSTVALVTPAHAQGAAAPTKVDVALEFGFQELGLNQLHPVWGASAESDKSAYKDDAAALFAAGGPYADSDVAGANNGKNTAENRALARKMIREAIDYLIPRQTIIDAVMNGYGAKLATPIIPQQIGFKNITVREYNNTKALELLEQATGIKQDSEGNYPQPFFKITLIAPTTNYKRTLWASSIAYELSRANIDAQVVWLSWNVLIPRVFSDPKLINGSGAIWDDGGFDGLFVGWGIEDVTPDPSSWFATSAWVPQGDNYLFLSDPTMDQLLQDYLSEPDPDTRKSKLGEIQQRIHDEVYKHIIVQPESVFAMHADIEGFDNFLIQRSIGHMSFPDHDKLVIAQPGDLQDFNPLVAGSYYDWYVFAPVYQPLAMPKSKEDTSFVPVLAESWSSSSDGLQWTVKLKQGVKFSNGDPFTADDVLFTWLLLTADDSVSPDHARFVDAIGDFNTVKANFEKVNDYEFKYTLPDFYPFFVETVLGMWILNMETYGFSSADALTFDAVNNLAKTLKTHASNTGEDLSKFVGTGPYTVSSVTAAKDKVTLSLRSDYDNDKLTPHLGTPSIQTIEIRTVKDPQQAVNSLKTGEIHFIDSQTGIQDFVPELTSGAGTGGGGGGAIPWDFGATIFALFAVAAGAYLITLRRKKQL